MDINRLIRIANHFDKIGAYTISDEFENKFIRTAAPADEKLFARDPKVTKRSEQTSIKKAIDFFTDFRKNFNLAVRSSEDIVQYNQNTWNLIRTWIEVFHNFSTNPIYTSDPKKLNLIKEISTQIFLAENNFILAKPASVRSGESHKGKKAEILSFANAEQPLLQLFVKFVDLENEKYGDANNSKYHPYLNNLRVAETLLYNLDALSSNSNPLPLPKTSATLPATTGSASTVTPPATPPVSPGGVSSSGSGAPSTGAGQGGGSAVSPSKKEPSKKEPPTKQTSTKPTSTKPTSTKPGKLKEDNANLELSKIVFRKYQAAHPEVEKRDILLNMRLVDDFTLKTYFDITKDPSLDGSIRAAIKASPYSQYFKDTMLKIYESKLKAAKEVNAGPVTPVADTPTTPSGGGETKTDTKTDTKTEEKKNDDFGFRCSREGLFTEIGRMDTLHNNDPDKYIRSYFGDIKRVIDCHESIRNSLNHKDNIQLDTSINILEAKYFSLINKTQFPY
jgi:hypothetical protein